MEPAVAPRRRIIEPVQLRPLDSRELLQLAAGWLADSDNSQWLEYGDGRLSITPEWLKVMSQRGTNIIRAYTAGDVPIGLVGLEEISAKFRTARIWVAAGDKSFRMRGRATEAGSKMLTVAFGELGLHAVTSWVVEINPSLRIVERLNFKFIGRQRECHYIKGRAYDRLWFDLLASEHREI